MSHLRNWRKAWTNLTRTTDCENQKQGITATGSQIAYFYACQNSFQTDQQQETNAQVIDNSTQGHLTSSSDFTSPEPKSASGKNFEIFTQNAHLKTSSKLFWAFKAILIQTLFTNSGRIKKIFCSSICHHTRYASMPKETRCKYSTYCGGGTKIISRPKIVSQMLKITNIAYKN